MTPDTARDARPFPRIEAPPAVHLVLHGKGGIGKTFVALLLAQYLRERRSPAFCWDVDPVNASLSAFPAIKARRLDLTDGNRLQPRNFDLLMEAILGQDDDAVVDVAASAFLPFRQYFADHDVPAILARSGRALTVHSIACGGPDEDEILAGVEAVANLTPPDAPIVLWINEFFGSVAGGIENTPAYRKHRDRILGQVTIPDYNPQTFGRDLADMLSRKLTFAEAVHPQTRHYHTLEKQRLVMIRRDIFSRLQLCL